MDESTKIFCKRYADAILNDCAAVLVGAGMSKPCGLPTWRELLRAPLKEIGLNVDKETDLLSAAQYFTNVKNRRSDLTQHIINLFTAQRAKPSTAHQLLASLPIKYVWTTNYDTLLEQAFEEQGKKVDTKRKPEDMCYPIPMRDVVIHKMHGDITLAGDITLITDDYEEYQTKNELFSNALKTDLSSKTFLFIGFSMSDPNILNMLGYMKQKLGKHVRPHFCIYKNIQKQDLDEPKDLSYAKSREALWIENLKRYGIEVIRIDSYEEIDTILKEIKRYVLSKSVFISGSADVYSPLEKEVAKSFIHNLAFKLAERGYKIVTGFGKGVGSSVIHGVLSFAYRQGRTIEGKLLAMPFPYDIKNKAERDEKWKQYREDMIAQAGNAIFIFGNKYNENKLSDGRELTNADGVRKEFRIAEAQGLKLFPVGQTGYAAKELWQTVSENKDLYYQTSELQNEVQIMNDIPIDRTSELVNAIVNCIDLSQDI